MSTLQKIDKKKFLEAINILEKHSNQEFQVKFLKGITEVPKNYRISSEWESWLIFSKIVKNDDNIKEQVEKLESFNFWKCLSESNVLFVYSNKNNDLSDIVVIENPNIHLKKNSNDEYELHNLSGPALEWEDGVKVYKAEGMEIPSKFYENPEQVTSKEIIKLDMEKRRLVLAIMGADHYFNALGSDKKLIDMQLDNQGNMMELYEIFDRFLKKDIKVLKVICPSTSRVYYLYPPDQDVTNVFDAKKSTFSNQNIYFRQGDVGLKRLDVSNPDTPLVET